MWFPSSLRSDYDVSQELPPKPVIISVARHLSIAGLVQIGRNLSCEQEFAQSIRHNSHGRFFHIRENDNECLFFRVANFKCGKTRGRPFVICLGSVSFLNEPTESVISRGGGSEHQIQRFPIQQVLPIEGFVPTKHIRGSGINSPSPNFQAPVEIVSVTERFAVPNVPFRHLRYDRQSRREAGSIHSQGLKNLVSQKVSIRFSGNRLDNVSEQIILCICVSPFHPWLELQWPGLKGRNQL